MENPWQGSFVSLLGLTENSALREKLLGYDKICITGASGWIGKEAVELISGCLGSQFQDRVTLVSSNGRSVSLDTAQFKTITWESFLEFGKFDLILHLAFLNQDKLADLGSALYLQINRKLTSDVLTVASRNSSGSILAASSGAAKCYRSDVNSGLSYEVYSGVKNEMEEAFFKCKLFKHIGLMRIWNISGVHASIQAPYALSSFISQGLTGDVIHVRGNPASTRAYVNAQEMLWVYLMALGNYDKSPLDSGGHITSLLNLAKVVASAIGGKKISFGESGEQAALTSYVPTTSKFDAFASEFSFKLSSLEEQVKLMVDFQLKSSKKLGRNSS
jgi:nucleoside-diphosphate-sugar epimerase